MFLENKKFFKNRMPFTSCPVTSYTDASLNEVFNSNPTDISENIYPLGGLLSKLPHTIEKGQLTETQLKVIIDNITSDNQKIIPTIHSYKNKEELKLKQNEFMTYINREYCHYYSRYAFCLRTLLNNINETNKSGTNSTLKNTIDNNLKNTIKLNTKLNLLIQIINKINITLRTFIETNEAESLESDRSLIEVQNKLKYHIDTLSSNNAITKLNKEMVKYTEEKARYTDNLLKMYSVLNIVVLGLLVYVYKSAS